MILLSAVSFLLCSAGTVHSCAETLYGRVHQIAVQLGDRADEAYALYGLGRCALERNDKPRAEYLLEGALSITEQLGNEELQHLIADDLISMISRRRSTL